jgi:hypothetical protein
MNNPFDPNQPPATEPSAYDYPQDTVYEPPVEDFVPDSQPEMGQPSEAAAVTAAPEKSAGNFFAKNGRGHKRLWIAVCVIGLIVMGLFAMGTLGGLASTSEVVSPPVQQTAPIAPEPERLIAPNAPPAAPVAPVPPTVAPIAPAPAAPAPVVDACEQRMRDHALANNADPQAYVAQNQAYLAQCRAVLAGQQQPKP